MQERWNNEIAMLVSDPSSSCPLLASNQVKHVARAHKYRGTCTEILKLTLPIDCFILAHPLTIQTSEYNLQVPNSGIITRYSTRRNSILGRMHAPRDLFLLIFTVVAL